eukprot:GHVN01033511.1.p1 GENE.GHVN01033511.1~~GHVN01033511.1.p1  ORF type:complete len:683 (+),score=69.72 GHVN01033511.1:15-2063(+)
MEDKQKHLLEELVETWTFDSEENKRKIAALFEEIFDDITGIEQFCLLVDAYVSEREEDVQALCERSQGDLLRMVQMTKEGRAEVRGLQKRLFSIIGGMRGEEKFLKDRVGAVGEIERKKQAFDVQISEHKDLLCVFQKMAEVESYLKKRLYADSIIHLDSLQRRTLQAISQTEAYMKIYSWIEKKKQEIEALSITGLHKWLSSVREKDELEIGKTVIRGIEQKKGRKEIREEVDSLEDKTSVLPLIQFFRVFEELGRADDFRRGYAKNRRKQFFLVQGGEETGFRAFLERLCGFHIVDIFVHELPQGISSLRDVFGVWEQSQKSVQKQFNNLVFTAQAPCDLLEPMWLLCFYLRGLGVFGFPVEGCYETLFVAGSIYCNYLWKETETMVQRMEGMFLFEDVVPNDSFRENNSAFLSKHKAEAIPGFFLVLDECLDYFWSSFALLLDASQMESIERLGEEMIDKELLCRGWHLFEDDVLIEDIELYYRKARLLLVYLQNIKERRNFKASKLLCLSRGEAILARCCELVSASHRGEIDALFDLFVYNEEGTSINSVVDDIALLCKQNSPCYSILEGEDRKRAAHFLSCYAADRFIRFLSSLSGKLTKCVVRAVLADINVLGKEDASPYASIRKMLSLVLDGDFTLSTWKSFQPEEKTWQGGILRKYTPLNHEKESYDILLSDFS